MFRKFTSLRRGLLVAILALIPVESAQAGIQIPSIGKFNWRNVEYALGNRQRMLQFGAVGMILGLWIMMKK